MDDVDDVYMCVCQGCGDVKYHLGTVMEIENNFTKKIVKLAVVANPSHLEGKGSPWKF